MDWTKEYFRNSYLGEYSIQKTWVSVENHGTFALLNIWFGGCKFSPREIRFNSVLEAKLAGESVMKGELVL